MLQLTNVIHFELRWHVRIAWVCHNDAKMGICNWIEKFKAFFRAFEIKTIFCQNSAYSNHHIQFIPDPDRSFVKPFSPTSPASFDFSSSCSILPNVLKVNSFDDWYENYLVQPLIQLKWWHTLNPHDGKPEKKMSREKFAIFKEKFVS